MQVTSRKNVVVLLDACRAWTNKTRESASSQECDARRLEKLQDELDTSRRTRVIPVVDRFNSPFYIIAFGAVVHHFERAWSARQSHTDRLKTVLLRDLITQITCARGVMKNMYNFDGWIRTWKNDIWYHINRIRANNNVQERRTTYKITQTNNAWTMTCFS